MESQPAAKKRRGPYRQYHIDPTLPIPKTTQWRMRKFGIEVFLDANVTAAKTVMMFQVQIAEKSELCAD